MNKVIIFIGIYKLFYLFFVTKLVDTLFVNKNL